MRESKSMGTCCWAGRSVGANAAGGSIRQSSPRSPWNYFSKLSLMRTKGKKQTCQLPSFSRPLLAQLAFLDLRGSCRESWRGPDQEQGCLFPPPQPRLEKLGLLSLIKRSRSPNAAYTLWGSSFSDAAHAHAFKQHRSVASSSGDPQPWQLSRVR